MARTTVLPVLPVAPATTTRNTISGSTGNVHRILAGPERRWAASSSLAYSRYAALLRPCPTTFWRSPEPGSLVALAAVPPRRTLPVDPLGRPRLQRGGLHRVVEARP